MDWSLLPSDLWSLIGSKLDTVADRVRFRAVSTSFRSILPFSQPIWLILPEQEQPQAPQVDGEDPDHHPQPKPPHPGRRGFIAVGEQQVHYMDFPEAHGKRCVSSAPGGWLVTADYDGNISLLNFFTKHRIDLPSQWSLDPELMFIKYDQLSLMNGFIRKVVFSSTDFINSQDWTAMVIFEAYCWLGVCKGGDTSWTNIISEVSYCEDIIFFRQQFYIVDFMGKVAIHDTSTGDSRYTTKRMSSYKVFDAAPHRWSLVEWMGELLLVKRLWKSRVEPEGLPDPHTTVGFEVYRRDFIKEEWIEVHDLGEYCLFLGLNTSIAVSIHSYTTRLLKKNCIYFSANRPLISLESYVVCSPQHADDIGMYSLEDESIQHPYLGICSPSCSLPMWIIPSLDQ